MASIFKAHYTATDPKTGKRTAKRTRVYYCEYIGADGRRVRRSTGLADKSAAEELARKWQHEAKLEARGLLLPEERAAEVPLEEHVGAFAQALASRGRTTKHVEMTRSRIFAVVGACGWKWLRDCDADQAAEYLATAEATRRGKPLSAASKNGFRRALHGFGRWLVRSRRWPRNPFESLNCENEQADRRHERRSLTDGEFDRLVAATRSGPEFRGLAPEGRALLYELARATGFRRGSLAALTPQDFDLDGSPPTVRARAASIKNRREQVNPIPARLVEPLRRWIGLRPRGSRVFPGTWQGASSRMIRRDLLAAKLATLVLVPDGTTPVREEPRFKKRIVTADESGRVFDFHSLRGQLGADCARRGVPLVVAQRLLGHSSPVLTSRHYTHLRTEDLAGAIEQIDRGRLANGKDAEAKAGA